MTSSVRFVHAADLHLDAPFAGIAASDPRIGAALADATYEAFRRIVDVCIERQVAFLVIAGDTYHSATVSPRAQLRFLTEMNRLAQENIEVFIVNGNHDPQGGWSAGFTLPPNVYTFPTDRVGRREVVRDREVVAAVYGRSYARSAETENLSLGFRRSDTDPIAIGVLHANVGGNTDYDPYAPATLDELRVAGMDYWALGHIHKQEVLAEHPWIVYPGSPQGLNPKETGPHGCLVVEVSPGGATGLEHVETGPVGWAHIAVDVSEAATLEEVRALLVSACTEQRIAAGRNTVARVTLMGRSAAHGDLARPGIAMQLFEDVRAEAVLADPWMWLDRLDERTASVIDLEALRGGPDFAAELVRMADELAHDPDALSTLIRDIGAPVAGTLPGYVSTLEPADALVRARDAALDLLLAEGGEVR